MKIMQILKPSLLVLVLSSIFFIGCSSDDDTSNAIVTVNGSALIGNEDDFIGDINGDFTGTGGSTSKTFNWSNSLSTADYNADITATASGTFRLVVKDANGTTVLDKSLNGATEPDSFSGVTTAGASGIWSVTITLTNFKGDGSFSLSQGT